MILPLPLLTPLTLTPLTLSPLLAEDGNQGMQYLTMLPILVIGILFYFMLIRPERAKRDQLEKLQNSLKKNDRVVTAGGILGVVVNATKGSEDVVLRIDDSNNTKIKVLRSHISRVAGGEDEDAKEK